MNRESASPGHSAARHYYLLLAAIGIFPFLVNGPVNARIATFPWLYWAFELLIWVAIPAGVLLAAVRGPGFRFADIGLHRQIIGYRGTAAVLLGCLVFSPLCYGMYIGAFELFDRYFPDGGFFNYETVIPEDGFLHYAVIVYFALSAGLVEEFLFRGMLYRASLEFQQPALWYLLVSPLLFSSVHWESGVANLLATWVYGLFSAAAYLLMRNLWPLIVGHTATDLLWFD